MREITKLKSNRGHGKMEYQLVMTELELVGLQKILNGKKIKKGSPLWNAIKHLKGTLPKIEVSVDRMADLLNPLKRYDSLPPRQPSGTE